MTDEPISAEAGGIEGGYTLALRPGTRVGERYVVLRLLAGTSDFALTYLGHDSHNDVAVVVKELLPRGLVGRSGSARVRAHSPEADKEFGRVLRRFVREGEILVDLRHPALAGAVDVVEDHGTGYLVMPRHETLRLSDHLPTVGGRLTTSEAVAFTDGLLGALETLHAEGILHREVSPSTVHVRHDGAPLLLGLGAWRHVPGRNREPVAGFDPIEQYGGRDVGPWSDVYGAAAVLYYLVTGTTPVSAIERAGGAQLRSPGVWAADMSPPMATAIVRGLSLAPEGRPHSAAELRRHLADAAAMSAEPTLPRVIAGLPPELAAHPGAANTSYRDDETAAVPFTLNSFGVVVPRNDGGVERTFKRVVDAAARLARRRTAERKEDAPAFDAPDPPKFDMPAVAAPAAAPAEALEPPPAETNETGGVTPPDTPPVAAGRRLDPVYDAKHVRTMPVEDERPEPGVPAPTAASPELDVALQSLSSEATSIVPTTEPAPMVVARAEKTSVVAAPEPSSDLVPSEPRVLMPTRRRRTPALIAAGLVAAGLIAAVAVPTALRARGASDRTARATPTREPARAAVAVSTPTMIASRLPSVDSARVIPQGAAAASKPPAAPPAATAGQKSAAPTRTASSGEVTPSIPRMPTIAAPQFTLPTSTGAPQLLAGDLVVDARSRVSVAGEQADQGNYAAARQTLAAALARLDSAAARASDSESLRGVRREIEAAQKRTAEACGAESDLRRRHGQTPLSCP